MSKIKPTRECYTLTRPSKNIKGIKLYGWENKFLNKIEDIYVEEIALKNRSEVRNMFYDFVGGCLH